MLVGFHYKNSVCTVTVNDTFGDATAGIVTVLVPVARGFSGTVDVCIYVVMTTW